MSEIYDFDPDKVVGLYAKSKAKTSLVEVRMFSHLYSIYVKNILNFANFSAKKGLTSDFHCIKPLLSI